MESLIDNRLLEKKEDMKSLIVHRSPEKKIILRV